VLYRGFVRAHGYILRFSACRTPAAPAHNGDQVLHVHAADALREKAIGKPDKQAPPPTRLKLCVVSGGTWI